MKAGPTVEQAVGITKTEPHASHEGVLLEQRGNAK